MEFHDVVRYFDALSQKDKENLLKTLEVKNNGIIGMKYINFYKDIDSI